MEEVVSKHLASTVYGFINLPVDPSMDPSAVLYAQPLIHHSSILPLGENETQNCQ